MADDAEACDPWISVADRLPPLLRPVDVWSSRRGRITDCVAYHIDDRGVASWSGGFGVYAGRATITHWMEIPGPPREITG